MPDPSQPPNGEPPAPEGGEGTPPETPPAPPARVPRRRRWYERKRLYLLVIVLAVMAGTFAGLWLTYEEQPRWLVLQGIKLAQVPAGVGKVDWETNGALSLHNIRMGDYIRVHQIDINWDWEDLLLRRRIRSIDIHSPQVWLGRLTDALESQKDEESSTMTPYTVDRLRLFNASIMLDNLGPDLPTVPITLGRSVPQVLLNFPLGNWKDAPFLDQEQNVYAHDVLITSPYDALSPIFTIDMVQITFTFEGILENKIKELVMTHPVLYVGPDLFWFTDKFDKARDMGSSEVAPWLLEHFSIVQGRMGINAFGTAGVVLPFDITTNAENVRLDQLDKLSAQNEIAIEEQDILYPEYQVKLLGVHGQIDFALPLTDKTADNVVPTIFFREATWNGVGLTDAWASVTFDQDGIYGKLGGNAYNGYATGNFDIYFAGGYPWRAQIFLTDTDVGPPAAQLIPSYLTISGAADGKLLIGGVGTTVYDSSFLFEMKAPGQMEIKSIDDLIARIPEDWSSLNRNMTRAVLESLRTFDYRIGRMSFDYGVPDSHGEILLKGPVVSRVFNINWHQDGVKPLPPRPDYPSQPSEGEPAPAATGPQPPAGAPAVAVDVNAPVNPPPAQPAAAPTPAPASEVANPAPNR